MKVTWERAAAEGLGMEEAAGGLERAAMEKEGAGWGLGTAAEGLEREGVGWGCIIPGGHAKGRVKAG